MAPETWDTEARAAVVLAVAAPDAADWAAVNPPPLCAPARSCAAEAVGLAEVTPGVAPLAWLEVELPVPEVEPPSAVVKFWLMSISCSRLFT